MLGSGVAGGAPRSPSTATPAPSPQSTRRAGDQPADLPRIAAAVVDSVVSITTGSGEGARGGAERRRLRPDQQPRRGWRRRRHRIRCVRRRQVRRAKIVGTDLEDRPGVVRARRPDLAGDLRRQATGCRSGHRCSPCSRWPPGSVTAGILSARDRTIQAGDNQQQDRGKSGGASSISGLLQTDARSTLGNSVALVNTVDQVIGINTAIATAGQAHREHRGRLRDPQQQGKDVAQKLQRGEKVSHPARGERQRRRGRRGRCAPQ
jgi:putative serine protease PepD